jgi:hypothetical protein
MGNIVNRVFDSSGPEGKVRGTPQQIIEKYHLLARDAQLSNDRVAEQNFLQHAEHYTRMLGEAQREMAREQEGRREPGEAQPYSSGRENGGRDRRDREREEGVAETGVADVIDLADGEGGSDLVETPEQRRAESGRRRPVFRSSNADEAAAQPRLAEEPQPRSAEEAQPKVAAQPEAPAAAPVTAPAQPAEKAEETVAPATEAAAEAAEKKPRRPRAPRKPRKTAEEAAAPAGASDPQTSAAE